MLGGVGDGVVVDEGGVGGDEIVWGSGGRVKNGFRYGGGGGCMRRNVMRKKGNYEENEGKGWKIGEIVVSLES